MAAPAASTVLGRIVTYRGYGDGLLAAYYARPAAAGSYPGILVIHEAFGVVDHVMEVTRRFAAEGYLAIAPDLYSREGGARDPADLTAALGARLGVPDARLLGDLEAALTFLLELPGCTAKLGSIGFCFGGRASLLLACRTTRLQAAVDCYGGRMVMAPEELNPAQPVAPVDLIEHLLCPLLGLFGEEDRNPSPEHVERLRGKLAKHRKEHRLVSYPNAGHAFFADYRPSYREHAARGGGRRRWPGSGATCASLRLQRAWRSRSSADRYNFPACWQAEGGRSSQSSSCLGDPRRMKMALTLSLDSPSPRRVALRRRVA